MIEVLEQNTVLQVSENDNQLQITTSASPTVIERGVIGPQGPPGPSGTGDKNYLHTQNLASNTWVINHNLGKFPSIEILDSAGTAVLGSINHVDTNTAIVTFSSVFGGTATCN